MTAKTIQNTIDTKADNELNGELSRTFNGFRNGLGIKQHQKIVVKDIHGKEVVIYVVNALIALQHAVFERRKEYRREKATEEFMEKINTLSADVEELKKPAEAG